MAPCAEPGRHGKHTTDEALRAKVPDEHDSHVEEPCTGAALPTAQAVQLDWPDSEDFPASQKVHREDSNRENRPASQRVHPVAPMDVALVRLIVNEPAEQLRHLSVSACGAYLPSWHFSQLLRSNAYSPAWHSTHELRSVDESLPWAQGVQLDAPAATAKLPAGHLVQFFGQGAVPLFDANVPTGHVWHTLRSGL